MSDLVYINEIFDSIQGEGLYIGERHLFIRFTGCNLSCNYCDTAKARSPIDSFTVSSISDKDDVIVVGNPVSSDELCNIICSKFSHIKTISFTGGEPLIHCKFLLEFIPKLQGQYKILLETNGTLFKELSSIIPLVDIISMDIKPMSATGVNVFDNQLEFLKIAAKKNVYVKFVITNSITENEIVDAISLIEQVNKDIPLILQPVASPSKDLVKFTKLINVMDYGTLRVNNLRIIPQVHKILEID